MHHSYCNVAVPGETVGNNLPIPPSGILDSIYCSDEQGFDFIIQFTEEVRALANQI